jgi:hypothetical protein
MNMKRLLTLLALTCAAATSFGATLNPVQLLNPTGSTAGQAIISTGSSSAPAWGNVTATALAAQAANTVVANVTGASASPTAFAMPSCSTSASALTWTSATGFTCNASINAATLGGATFAAPGAIGGTTPSTGTFTALTANNSVNNATAIVASNTGSNGAILQLAGNGATTPSKFIRVLGGQFQIVNSAFASNILTLSDAGGLTVPNIDGSIIGATTPAAGSFTALSASGNDALLYQTTNALSVPNATATTVTTWTKVSDRVNANFNASTGVFTAPATGQYLVSAGLSFASGMTGGSTIAIAARIVANGVTVAGPPVPVPATTTTAMGATVTAIVSLTAGQTIVVQAFQNSGAAVSLAVGSAYNNYVSIARLP